MVILILILKCIFIVLISLLLLLCLVLFVPFTYVNSGTINKNIALNGYIKWLFGLVIISADFKNKKLNLILTICKIHFNISNLISKHKTSNKAEVSNKHKHHKNKKNFSINNLISSLPSNYKKFKDIINIIKPNSFNISGYFGFDDPCLTGQLTAILSVLIHSKNVNLVPIYDKKIIDIKAELGGSIKAFSICYIFLKYFIKRRITNVSIKKKLFTNKKCIS